MLEKQRRGQQQFSACPLQSHSSKSGFNLQCRFHSTIRSLAVNFPLRYSAMCTLRGTLERRFSRHQSRPFFEAPPGHIKRLDGDLSLTQLGRGRPGGWAGGLALMPCVADRPLGLSHRVGVTGGVCCCSGPQQEETERCERHESLIINASRQTQLLLPFAPSAPSRCSEQKDGCACMCVLTESFIEITRGTGLAP